MSTEQQVASLAPRIYQKGACGNFFVSGWRYPDLPIWHVQVDHASNQTFLVAAGEFYPASLSNDAKIAVLRCIGNWEDGLLVSPRMP